MRRRTNSFQRMMLNWEDLHPYNAVHAVELPGKVPPERLQECIQATLEAFGASSVCFDPSRRHLEYRRSTEPVELKHIHRPADPAAALANEITAQLNRPFPGGPHSPFRFFFIEAEGRWPCLGITYHHAVGDAASIAELVWRILKAVSVPGPTSAEPRMNLHPPSLGRLFASELALRRAPVLLSGLLRDCLGYRRCHIPAYGDEEEQAIAFRIYGTGLPVAALREHARRHGATVQDVLFAALLEGMGRLFPERERRDCKRKRFALATAIDLRRHADGALRNTLGQFLGSYSVMHPVPDGVPFSQLLAEVAAQTRRTKDKRLYFNHIWSFTVMAALWPLLSLNAKRQFARWLFPLMGAISNMDLTHPFAQDGVRDYIRAASTGPITPVLLDITTVGESFNLTATYRVSAFSTAQMDALMTHVRERLASGRGEGETS